MSNNRPTLYDLLTNNFFKLLQDGNIKYAIDVVHYTLFHMYAKRMITYKTIETVISTLKNKMGFDYIEMESDGVINGYMDDELFDQIKTVDLENWLFDSIVNDEICKNKGDFESLKNKMNEIHPTEKMIYIYGEMKECSFPIFTETQIFWLEKDKDSKDKKSYSLYKAKCNVNDSTEFDIYATTIVARDVYEWIRYDEEANVLYLIAVGIDGYVSYDIDKDRFNVNYGRRIIDKVVDGGVWYNDINSYLYYSDKNENTTFGEIMPDCICDVSDGKKLIVKPDSFTWDFFAPYIINVDGTKEESERLAAKYMWKLIIDEIYIRSRMRMSEEFLIKEIYEEPYPFTINNVKEKLAFLADRGLVKEEKFFSIIGLCDLLKEKGYSINESVTNILFTFVKYEKLCMRNWRNLGIFHKEYYIMIYKISKKPKFIWLLENNPEELFMDNIYWTDERQQEYYLELKHKNKKYKLFGESRQNIGVDDIEENQKLEINLCMVNEALKKGITSEDYEVLANKWIESVNKKIEKFMRQRSDEEY